jgi:hypothetical protein
MTATIRSAIGAFGIAVTLAAIAPVAESAHAQARVHRGHTRVSVRVATLLQLAVGRVPRVSVIPAAPAAHVDLTYLAPPVGDQGSVASCASWVMSEYLYSLAMAGGMSVGPFAPMFLYSQITHGVSVGTTLQQNLSIVTAQGIEPASSYTYGPSNAMLDFSDQPTPIDHAAAGFYRLTGADWLYWVHASEQQIESWMSSTHRPVVFVMNLYHNFDYAGHTDGAGVSYPLLIQPPPAGMAFRGGHMVIGYRTDANGVWFMNSWGTGYGRNGWAELSWSFIQQQAIVYVLHSRSFGSAERPS